MPEVIDWPQGESLETVTRAVQVLREGRLVILPTESVYVVAASGLFPEAVTTLTQAAGKEPGLTLLLAQAAQVFDWLPFFRGVGVRLARRFWPGPLTLVSGTGLEQGVFPRLPQSVRQVLAPRGELAVRLADHSAARKVAARLATPLVAAGTRWTTAEEVKDALSDRVGLVIQDGRTTFAQPDTEVQVQGRQWRVLREGAIPTEEIAEAAPCRIVFVCTGNTCRSPLAEGLCRKVLADKLECLPEELAQRGFIVQSAGLAAMMGSEAAPEAVAVARDLGADLNGHSSRPLTIEVLLEADRLFAMTASHLRMLYGVRGVTPRLLAPRGEDIADPIGGTPEIYQDCARQIKSHLQELLPELCEC